MSEFKRVGIYLRLSSEDKDKDVGEDSESIKNQRNMLIDYINRMPNFFLVDEYCDEDLSGAGTYRPEFERLIKDCELQRLDVVLCKSQSRFSRDMEIVEKYINNKFREWNIRFIGLSDNADTQVAGNKKARQINGLVNEWYLEDVSLNIRSAFLAKMKQGECIAPFAAYGYKINPVNNNQLIIDEEASLIVKEIYQLYLKGYGFLKIAKYLNERNIPSPSYYKYLKGIKLNVVSNKLRKDIKWNANAIKTILTNEVYIGNLIQGKRTTVSYKNHKIVSRDKSKWVRMCNTHEAIIDKDTFNKVQGFIKDRVRYIKRDGKIHNLAGKIYCFECLNKMRKKKTVKYNYLVCTKYDQFRECCNNYSIRYDELESILLNKINNMIDKYLDKSIIEREFNKEFENIYKIKRNDEDIKNLSNKKDDNFRYLKKIYEDKVNGLIDDDMFLMLRDNYSKQNKYYNSLIDRLNKDRESYIERDIILERLLGRFINIKILNRMIVEEFIDKVYVGKIDSNRRNIFIMWNF